MKRSTVLLLDFGSLKQKNLVVLNCRVKNLLEFDVAIFPMEYDRMLFKKQYLVSDAAAAWDQHCARYLEGD
jgi:hypothetical protein